MRRVVITAAWCALVACRQGPVTPAPTTETETPPEEMRHPGPPFQHATTPAGMAVAFHDEPQSGRMALSLVLPAGTLHEPPDAAGAMSLLVNTLRRAGMRGLGQGPNLMGHELSSVVESSGLEMTVDADLQHLLIQANGPARHAALATTLVCGLAFAPLIPPELIDVAREEALDAADERAQGSSQLADEVLRAALFSGHALARPALPHPSAVETLDTHAIISMHTRAARPAQSLLLAAGGDGNEILKAANTCRAWQPSLSVEDIPSPPPRLSTGRTRRIHVHATQNHSAFIKLGGRAPPPATPEAAALSVLIETVANGFSSSLVRQLRAERGQVYGVEGAVSGVRQAGWWSVSTSTSAGHAVEVAEVMQRTLAELHERGMTSEAWRGAARAMALGFAYGREAVTELLAVEIDGWILGRMPGETWRTPAWLWNLDAEWAWRVVKPYLDPGQMVLVVVLPRTGVQGAPPDVVIDAETWPVEIQP
ncbi:MAG: insulinase family protein [Myxococcota bacterium]